MKTDSDCLSPLRVAVIGCGAVAERYHLPVLAGHEQVVLAALVDRDIARARSLAAAYGVSTVLADPGELKRDEIDAAVIATPAAHHAACAISLLERGVAVLVEKPMATNLADAEAMVAAADRSGCALSVGVFRRLLPSLRLLKAAIAAEVVGRPVSFDLEGGAVYGWGAATLGNMLKEQAGGGILMDMGPHFLDQLLELFDGPGEVVQYQDNALGGVESDCLIRLRLSHQGQPIEGRVEMSRTRNLGNELRVVCDRGELAIPPSDRYRVVVRHNDLQLNDPRTGRSAAHRMELTWADEPETPWYETFRAEIDDWVNAILEKRQPVLSGRSALQSARLIDSCYQNAESLPEPWSPHPLMTRPADRSGVRVLAEDRRVLVTGASGFIGFRVSEILSQRAGYRVRAAVHNPANASRIARLPVELVQADLSNADDVERLVRDCDAVVHCAIGTETWDRGQVYQVTVEGTRSLVRAAKNANLSRFVHLSTIAVHPDEHVGTIDETTPLAPPRGSLYGESKLAAERAVSAEALSSVVIRPGCVYGPFGKTFITRPIEALIGGRLMLSGSERTPSNTVYVDNLVEAIVLSLEAKQLDPKSVFAIADDDGWTWGQFYGYFADRVGTRYQTEPNAAQETNGSHRRPGWITALKQLSSSDEAKALARKALWTDPLGQWPRSVLERSPRMKTRLKKLMRLEGAAVYRRPSSQSGDLHRLTPRLAEVRSARARDVLGWKPTLTREECLQRTWDWLVAARLVPPPVGDTSP